MRLEYCCTPDEAWAWTQDVAWLAMQGDEEAELIIGNAVDHYLQAVRRGRAIRLRF